MEQPTRNTILRGYPIDPLSPGGSVIDKTKDKSYNTQAQAGEIVQQRSPLIHKDSQINVEVGVGGMWVAGIRSSNKVKDGKGRDVLANGVLAFSSTKKGSVPLEW